MMLRLLDVWQLLCCIAILTATSLTQARPLNQSVPWSKTVLSHPVSFPRDPISPAAVRGDDVDLERRQGGGYWYESASHGISPFGPSGYQVFRNVKDFGATGDGVTDDTEAINNAITAGGRCGEDCGSSTVTPAVVYFPAGTYVISAPLIQYYYTQFVGNPNNIPVLKASPDFSGIGVISSNTYIPGASGAQWYVPQSNFHRQVRNFVIDISDCPNATPDGFAPTGIHWQVAQATSLQNIRFIMSQAPGTTHMGIFMENGSGGFLGDLTFIGGAIGMRCGSQQFTSRNLRFQFCIQAIEMIWDWGWTWHGLDILLCQIGINVTALTSATALHNQGVGAIAVLDSVFTNVPIAILHGGRTNIMLENVQLNNAPIAIGYSGGPTTVQGGDVLIDNYGLGNNFIQNGGNLAMNFLNGAYSPSAKAAAPSSLRTSSGWFARSKPQYENLGIGSFIDVRTAGAAGDGATDDTAAINSVLASAAGRVVYFPHGVYIVSDTIEVPPGTRMVGEIWSEIMGRGARFQDISDPHVMVRVGTTGSTGLMEISDMLFTVSGPTAGAILMEWNIAQSSQGSAAMWDAHIRVGGAVGSNLQFDQCPWSEKEVNTRCIAATMLFHITASGNGYLENVWIWTADHDLDIPAQSQVNVYTARAFLVESKGPLWLWATAPEHSTLYQYRFYNAENIFAATLQTESPYYQPEPKAPAPFTGAFALPDDPTFSYCSPNSATCAYSWAMEVIGSSNLMIYGAGFYSWFQWYNQACLLLELCQERVARVIDSDNIFIVNLYTKGTYSMIQGSSSSDILTLDNKAGFLGTIVGWTGLDVAGSVDTLSNIIPLPPWIWDVPNPTVSCHIPCQLLPPPTPILPILPPVYTTTVSGQAVTVTPPAIETPHITVQPVTVVVPNRQTVVPFIVPTPVIVVPPIIPTTGNFPGGPPNIKPPDIFLPIPLPLYPPGACLQFCSAAAWPPILPPIVVVEGNPIPVGVPPPESEEPEEEDELPSCVKLIPIGLGGYPGLGDLPDWGQPGEGTTGGTCGWSGDQIFQNTYPIAVASGQSSFMVNVFDLLGFGSSSYTIDGAAMQVYSTSVTAWSIAYQPTSLSGSSSNRFWINFDVPTNPIPVAIIITGTVQSGVRNLELTLSIRASTQCGGSPIPDPPGAGNGGGGGGGGGSLDLLLPTFADGRIDCADNSQGGGVRSMTSCLFSYGSLIVQGQLLAQGSSITTQDPENNCVRHGVTTDSDGVILNNWCMVYSNTNCAFVISDKYPTFGGFPGYSVISGEVFRNFAIIGANQCAGSSKTAVAAGPFQPFGIPAQSLCLVHPDHPEICAVT
ncbi:pectate lyase superfamily protein-domain-containing protein [Xylaria digitata]|nr:pectate lyase superfamily protein-domain-containing protein [Xylaria digitata]